MNEESKDTLISNQTILDAINNSRQEMNQAVSDLSQEMNERFNKVEARLDGLDERVKIVESEVFSINVRLMRLESMAHEAISISKSVQADVMVLRAEVTSWTQDVMDLQKKVA